MSELLWTLSLVAQNHLAQSPTLPPLPQPERADLQQAIARWQALQAVGGARIDGVNRPSPEFSTMSRAEVLKFYTIGDRPLPPLARHSSLAQVLKPRKSVASPALGTLTTEDSSPAAQPSAASPVSTSALRFQVPAIVAASMPLPELLEQANSTMPRPISGSQLYAQRLEALRLGKTYTRLPANSFQAVWHDATYHPQYEDWLALLRREADAMERGQGHNRLTVLLGDSLSQWFPNDQLPSDRFWLNQGISGDTSAGVLRRLSFIGGTNPDVIHVMVGINDLRGGATDAELLANMQQIMRELHQRHPAAQVYVHSLLPTRLPAIPNDRITGLNQAIAQLAETENVAYLDLQTTFADAEGNLRRELTTDGLHLSRYGYALWQSALRWFQLA